MDTKIEVEIKSRPFALLIGPAGNAGLEAYINFNRTEPIFRLIPFAEKRKDYDVCITITDLLVKPLEKHYSSYNKFN